MLLAALLLLADYSTTPAPVASVNNQLGAVIVTTVQRQTSTPIDISSGSVTWTFPTTFANQPNCWPTITSSNTNYVFAQPVTTAITTTAVTVTETAALKLLSISLGALTVWGNPPSGTNLTLTCIGALP